MTDISSIFCLFPSSKSALRLDSLNLEKLTPSVVHLFNEVVEEFLKVQNNSSESKSEAEEINLLQFLNKIDSVLDYIWEQLHTGEWRNVDEAWRHLYSYSSIFKAFVCLKLISNGYGEVKQQLINAVTASDMGLIMGIPVLDGLLSNIADSINSKLWSLSESKKCRLEEAHHKEGEASMDQLPPQLDTSKLIEVIEMPSIEKFMSEIMNKKPAILSGKEIFSPFKKKVI